jgi:hypothetical protein
MSNGKLTENEPFTAPCLLLVEGKDEEEFFPFLTEARNLSSPRIWNMAGRGNLKKALLAIFANTGFEQLKKIGLVLDSEDDLQETQRLKASFESYFQDKAPDLQLSYLQLPATNQTGSFERICLNSIEPNDPLFACSQQFIDCIQLQPNALSTQALKDAAQLLAWYTAKSGKPISRIGISERSDLKLDAMHSAFDSIADFITELNHV